MCVDEKWPDKIFDYEMPDDLPQYDVLDNAVVVALRIFDFLTKNRNLTIRPERTYLDLQRERLADLITT